MAECKMSPSRLLSLSLAGLLALAAAPVRAAEAPEPDSSAWFAPSEIKVGALYHDPVSGKEHGGDLNAEIYSKPFLTTGIGGVPLTARFNIGGTANTAGDTSFGYFGVTLDGTIDRFYTDLDLDLAIHDGELTSGPANRKLLGSRVLFRESLDLGYQLTPVVGVSAYVDHLSNGSWLSSHNQALETTGLRLSYRPGY